MRMRISVMGLGQMIMVVYVLRLGVAGIRFLLTMQSYGKILNRAISIVREMNIVNIKRLPSVLWIEPVESLWEHMVRRAL